MAKVVVDLPFGIEDLDKIFDVMEFLDNRDELVEEFTPEVKKYLVKKDFFKGPFRLEYERNFDELIRRLIKNQLVNHFNFTPEELLLITEVNFLKMITEGYYFDTDNYFKERK